MNKKTVLLVLSVIWIGTLLAVGIVMLDENALPYHLLLRVTLTNTIFTSCVVFLGACLLLTIHGYLYLVSIRQFNRERTQFRAIFGREQEQRDLRRRRIKTTVVSLAFTISYLITSIPITISMILFHQNSKYASLGPILGPLSIVNPLIDPVLYGLTVQSLTKHIIKEFKGLQIWLANFIEELAERKTRRQIRVHSS